MPPKGLTMSEDRDPTYVVREVVGVFGSGDKLETACANLEAGGFRREEISVMASHEAVVENLDHRFETIKQLEDDPRVPRAAFIAKSDFTAGKAAAIGIPVYIGATVGSIAVVASGGALALAVAAAVAGGLTGGGLGGLAAHAIGEKHAEALQEHIAAGGLLLWVRISDQAREDEAIGVLTASGGEHVHAHDIRRTWGAEDVPLHDWQPDPLLENS
jgi:hypothetical protein